MAQQESTSSKLIGKVREISRGAPAPLGFGRAPAQRIQSMLLLVRLGRNEASLAEAAVAAGADALVCHLYGSRGGPSRSGEASQGAEAAPGPETQQQSEVQFRGLAEERPNLEAILKVARGRPVGVAVGTAGTITMDDLNELARMGIDFVAIHPQRAPATLLGIEALGHVVQLDREYPSGPLRGINELGIDAVELTIGRPDNSLPQLTIHDLANFRQLIDSIRRPVLVPTAWAAQASDLTFFHGVGVEALVLTPELLGEGPENVRARVAEYRQAIDRLPPPIGRGRALEGRRVVLPQVKVQAGGEEEEDDDE